jgi:hypothetical protein
MKRHEALIDLEANARDISEATKMRQELRAWKEDSLDNIHNQESQQSAKEFRTVTSWLQVAETDQISIFESTYVNIPWHFFSLNPPASSCVEMRCPMNHDFETHIRRLKCVRSCQGDKHPGTCTWIHQNKEIRDWLQDGPNTPILWLSGNAGFGKSVIATQVINFIKIARKTVFHHFCTYTSAASSNYDQVLKSLLLQVLREDEEWTSQVYNDFIIKRKAVTISVLEQLLRTVLTSSLETLNGAKYIWIILDGVDELSENMQLRLLSLVKHISGRGFSTGSICCKFLLSCRSSRTIAHGLRKKARVSLTDQKPQLTKAITEYSRQRLQLIGDRFQQLGMEQHDMDSIGRTIADKADGECFFHTTSQPSPVLSLI